jgi:hypothetical protein
LVLSHSACASTWRGVHTKYEGEWERMEDPNRDMDVMCWYAGIHVVGLYTLNAVERS